MRPYEAIQTLPLDWCRASFCQNGECVEVAAWNDTVIMRKSTQPDSPYLYFTAEEFGSFIREAKAEVRPGHVAARNCPVKLSHVHKIHAAYVFAASGFTLGTSPKVLAGIQAGTAGERESIRGYAAQCA